MTITITFSAEEITVGSAALDSDFFSGERDGDCHRHIVVRVQSFRVVNDEMCIRDRATIDSSGTTAVAGTIVKLN